MSYQSFENLEVWKESCRLSVEMYKMLVSCKDYSFRDQMQRAGISIPSNIAEGAERGSDKDFIRFLHYAKGSAGELRTQLYIAEQVNIISGENRMHLTSKLISISKMLHALIKSLKEE